MDPGTPDELDQAMASIAEQTGATLHTYPRPGRPVRRVVLRDTRDDRGAQFEAAQMEDDGALRIVGHDTGAPVSDFFGTRSPATNGCTWSRPGGSRRLCRR
jgi:hypothetical protein